MTTSQSQRNALKRYQAKTVMYALRFRIDSDADVIKRMRSVENKTDYIRRLVRSDIARGSK